MLATVSIADAIIPLPRPAFDLPAFLAPPDLAAVGLVDFFEFDADADFAFEVRVEAAEAFVPDALVDVFFAGDDLLEDPRAADVEVDLDFGVVDFPPALEAFETVDFAFGDAAFDDADFEPVFDDFAFDEPDLDEPDFDELAFEEVAFDVPDFAALDFDEAAFEPEDLFVVAIPIFLRLDFDCDIVRDGF